MNFVAVWRSLLLFIVLAVSITSAKAEPPRTALKAPPRIGGREVKELVLTAPVNMGSPLPPGLPTVRIFTIKPGRFVPVSENPSDVYYQAEGGFAEGTGEPGGLRVSKIYPDKVCAYWGNGRYLKIKLSSYDCMPPGDVRKIRVRFAGQGKAEGVSLRISANLPDLRAEAHAESTDASQSASRVPRRGLSLAGSW